MSSHVHQYLYETPSFSIVCICEADGVPTTNYTYTGELPRELMDAYQEVAGNGQARVSVSTDMGVKNFGNGASAMVNVSLTCNQDQTTLQKALELASQMGRWYAVKYQREAEEALAGSLATQGRTLQRA